MTTTTTAPTTTAAPPAYSLTVRVDEPDIAEGEYGKAYSRVRFTVIDAVDMPAEVFVHQRRTDPTNSFQPYLDVFTHIAGPLDFSRISTTPDTLTGYFRKDTADILIDHKDHAAATSDKIQAALQYLVNGLKSLDHMQATDQFTIEPQV